MAAEIGCQADQGSNRRSCPSRCSASYQHQGLCGWPNLRERVLHAIRAGPGRIGVALRLPWL